MPRPPRIGVTANFMHADPERALFKGKTLQFAEQKMMHAVHRAGGVPVFVPDLDDHPDTTGNILDGLDGLLLTGGADVAPQTYGEEPIDPRWPGDPVRDAYEKRFILASMDRKLPVLGICRGIQIINASLGGTLYQDIQTQVPDALVHRDWHRYETIEHTVTLEPGSWVSERYDHIPELLVNTVHHQAIKDVAAGFAITARAPDGIVEAMEAIDGDRWVVGIQWHPEWLDGSQQGGPHRPPGDPVFRAFIELCRQRGP